MLLDGGCDGEDVMHKAVLVLSSRLEKAGKRGVFGHDGEGDVADADDDADDDGHAMVDGWTGWLAGGPRVACWLDATPAAIVAWQNLVGPITARSQAAEQGGSIQHCLQVL